MEINVAQLLKLPIGTTRTFEVDEEIDIIEESGNPSRFRGEVKLLRTKVGILVRASLHTAVPCTCSRCLETTDCKLQLKIEEEYLPTVDVNTGYPVAVPADSTAFTISANHVISLDEAARQYVLINQPMQPLCKPDCAGLCPECGANLNFEQCDCHLQATDNPLAALSQLLDSNDDASASNERS